MRILIRLLNGLCLSILLASFGCSVSYDEEMMLAQEAMDEAKTVRAEELASADWEHAMESWNEAQTAASNNQASARTLFMSAKSRFNKAYEIANARKEHLAKEVGDMQLTIATNYARLKSAAEIRRLSSKIKKSLEESFEKIDTAISTLNSQVSNEDYVSATTTAQDTLQQIYDAEQLMEGKK